MIKWNPVKENDWQALNIALEEIITELKMNGNKSSNNVIKKLISSDIAKTVEIIGNPSAETLDSTNELVESPYIKQPVFESEQGYVENENGQQVIVSPDSFIDKTKSENVIPSSYFLDLRGNVGSSASKRDFSADWITLHDKSSPWKTIGLPNISVTNDISIAGPIADGRDQAAEFTYRWTYFFVIYNSSSNKISSLSSNSPTAPTLPAGYDYFVRVGSAYTSFSPANIDIDTQLNEYHWDYVQSLYDAEPVTADTYEAKDLGGVIPPTAKRVIGYFGLSSSGIAVRGMAIASTASGQNEIAMSFDPGNAIAGYGLRNAVFFDLPILEAQTIYWKGSVELPIYGLTIHAYVDDI